MIFLSIVVNLAWQAFFICMGVIGIGFLIGFHEFGHFIFCKLFGVHTPTFSIGMGPRVLSKKIGETEFMLSAIPLGGYVEIAGADDQEKSPKTPRKVQFSAKPYYQKMLIIAGGIFFNILFSYIALSFLFWRGMPNSPLIYPKYASSEIKTVEPGSPAFKAALKPGDNLIAIDNELFKDNAINAIHYIRNNPGKKISITYQRNNKEYTTTTLIEQQTIQNKSFGKLGVEFLIPQYPFLQAIKQGINATHQMIGLIFQLFKKIFQQRDFENLGGPLMVIQQTIKGAEKGINMFLLILAFISINLAVLNIFPLPIMDGGQALLYTIEAVIRRPLPETMKLYIKYACWIFFLSLALLLSIKDIFYLMLKK